LLALGMISRKIGGTKNLTNAASMKVQPAAFLRTTLPLDLSVLPSLDSGRYHSIWLPDHMVSFWPDSIWTPEFTDLATASPSPHRHLDGLAVAAAAAVLTEKTPLATSVVDTVRRHPSSLAQTALTIDHLAKGRFILGLGSGETENTVPYGFDFSRPVGRFEEALKLIRLLWESEGPVDFEGRFYKLHHARLDTEPYQGRFPQIWIGAAGPRMLDITGRFADGWWPAGAWTPEDYAAKLAVIRAAAERAGRDPLAIVPATIQTCLIGDDDELGEILAAPLVKAHVLQISSELLNERGFSHPLGDDWNGYQDINPAVLPRERIVDMLSKVTPEMIMSIVPTGNPKKIASIMKGFVDAGLRVPKILDYGGMAGLKYAARSAQKVRETEDALLRLVGQVP
jgi:phthiodiolone/phenolphthiodiolone dimycocerosates ketoreductase